MTTKEVLIEYMKRKIDQEDWHAVSDAANDLRVLEEHIACAKDQLKIPFDKDFHQKTIPGMQVIAAEVPLTAKQQKDLDNLQAGDYK